MELDCQKIDEGLVEFLYGELDDEAAAAMKQHIESCNDCGASANRLQESRDLFSRLEPSPLPEGFDDAILAAAAAKAQEMGAAHQRLEAAATTQDQPRESWFDRLIATLGSAAWRPALGTTVVVLLVAGVGLLFLRDRPEGSYAPTTDGQMTRVPVEELRAATPAARPAPPVPQIPPQEPLEEQAPPLPTEPQAREARSDRLTKVADQPRPARGARPAQPLNRQPAPARDNLIGDQREASGDTSPLEIEAQLVHGAPPAPNAVSPIALDLPSAPRAMAPAAAPPPPVIPTPPMPSGAGPVDQQLYRAQSQSPTSSDVDEAQAPTPPQSGSELYDRGMDSYRTGQYRDAAEELNDFVRSPSAPRNLLPSGLHTLALSHQRSGNLSSAARVFDQLLSGHPSYTRRPQAMLEAAQVHARLGNLARAEDLLRQLQAIPGWNSRAQSELAQIQRGQAGQEADAVLESADEATEEVDNAPASAPASGY